MSREAVHLFRKEGLLTGRDAVWYAIRALRTFTLADIELFSRDNDHVMNVRRENARTYIQGLEAAGFIRRLIDGKSISARHQNQWILTNDVGVDAPRVRKNGQEVTQGRAREQMWRTMRILNDFNATDLEVTASTQEVKISENTAKDYIYNLHKAGYLILTTPAKNSGGLSRYRLLPSMYSGPKPPMVQRVKQVFDPNWNKVMWPKEGE